MKRFSKLVLVSFMALSCAVQNKSEGLQIPIIKYNPATYLSDIESALANPAGYECLPDSLLFSGMDRDILTYLSEQDAFVVSLNDGDTEVTPEFIGLKDKEKGYLKYLNIEKEHDLNFRMPIHMIPMSRLMQRGCSEADSRTSSRTRMARQ